MVRSNDPKYRFRESTVVSDKIAETTECGSFQQAAGKRGIERRQTECTILEDFLDAEEQDRAELRIYAAA